MRRMMTLAFIGMTALSAVGCEDDAEDGESEVPQATASHEILRPTHHLAVEVDVERWQVLE